MILGGETNEPKYYLRYIVAIRGAFKSETWKLQFPHSKFSGILYNGLEGGIIGIKVFLNNYCSLLNSVSEI